MFDEDDNDLSELKKDDSYHFTFPFTYCVRKLGEDEYEDSTGYMDVDLEWSDADEGYNVTYHIQDGYDVDPEQGNGDEDEIYENDIYYKLMDELASLDMDATALVDGGSFS